jgi:hypothetical protein
METLRDNLTHAGTPPAILDVPEGGRLLVLPAYGRVLGLYTGDSDANFFWTNPALETAASAAAYFRCDGWRNPGGDRTWLAPEIELFIGDLARPGENYTVPAALDPGHWRCEEGVHGLRLRNESAVELKRSGRTVRFTMVKEYRSAANPLHELKLELAYAGYEQTTILELEVDKAGLPPVRLGIWNLLQLPTPGRMLVSTSRRAAPRTVFGTVAPGDLALADQALVWRMPEAGGNVKISIKADELTSRAGYLCRARGSADDWELVVRTFAVTPSGDYVDALWDDPADTGYAFQACAVTDGAERFNELEYHAPAAASTEGRNRTGDRSQLWAFRGGSEAIAEAARVLLCISDLHCPPIPEPHPVEDRNAHGFGSG